MRAKETARLEKEALDFLINIHFQKVLNRRLAKETIFVDKMLKKSYKNNSSSKEKQGLKKQVG